MTKIHARNPRVEAAALLPGTLAAAVLEPSPPAINVGPWFADDPIEAARLDPSVVSPLPTGHATWEDAADSDPSIAAFARDHWLADHKPLPPAPANLVATRIALNALAFYVISLARHRANGKIALRWTKGEFGTPFFGADRQVRVEGDVLVVQDGGTVVSEPITTLRAAGAFVGVTPGAPEGIDFHDQPVMPDLDEPLDVDPVAVAFLDDWFGFATYVLERLRFDAGSPEDTRVQMWAEHFDPAIELGNADDGHRASYGASPGDADHASPYLYVSPWSKQEGPFWTASFGGAAITLDELRAAPDAIEAAREFFARGRALLS